MRARPVRLRLYRALILLAGVIGAVAAVEGVWPGRLHAGSASQGRVAEWSSTRSDTILAAAAAPEAITAADQPAGDDFVVTMVDNSGCGASLQARVDAATPGSALLLEGCEYTAGANLHKSLTLIGGKLTSPTNSPWSPSIAVTADNVTLDGWTFVGGGIVVSVYGRSDVVIANSSFSGQVNAAIALWGEGRGSHDVTVRGNTITQTATFQVSPIIGRASEDCSVLSRGLSIQDNVIDQGAGSAGWFGIELKCHEDVVIEGNTLSRGQVLVSLPETDNVTIRGNTFDMRGSVFWGVEVANAMHVTVHDNVFFGDGPNGGDHAVSMNSGSRYTTVSSNSIDEIRTVLDTTGSYITVRDNCLNNVLRLTEYEVMPFVERVIANNGPC